MIFGLISDAPVIILLTIPILYPMLEAIGIDLIYFGVLAALVGGLGSISPPYAVGIYVLRAVACPDVPLGTMFRGILPFCLSTVVVVALLVAYPQLTLWLPSIMH
jgi:TRAP-type C4-dicarboxylate transport system permease large subunit